MINTYPPLFLYKIPPSLFLHTSIFATSHKGFHAYGYPIDVLKIHSGKKVLFLDKIVFERTWDPT